MRPHTPFVRISPLDLTTSQRPHLLISPHWGPRFQHMDLRETQSFSPLHVDLVLLTSFYKKKQKKTKNCAVKAKTTASSPVIQGPLKRQVLLPREARASGAHKPAKPSGHTAGVTSPFREQTWAQGARFLGLVYGGWCSTNQKHLTSDKASAFGKLREEMSQNGDYFEVQLQRQTD